MNTSVPLRTAQVQSRMSISEGSTIGRPRRVSQQLRRTDSCPAEVN